MSTYNININPCTTYIPAYLLHKDVFIFMGTPNNFCHAYLFTGKGSSMEKA